MSYYNVLRSNEDGSDREDSGAHADQDPNSTDLTQRIELLTQEVEEQRTWRDASEVLIVNQGTELKEVKESLKIIQEQLAMILGVFKEDKEASEAAAMEKKATKAEKAASDEDAPKSHSENTDASFDLDEERFQFVGKRKGNKKSSDRKKSVIKAGNAEIFVEEQEDEGIKNFNFKANNSKHPKIPEAKTIDPRSFIQLEKDFLEYKRKCRSKDIVPCSIVDCFSTQAMDMLKWGSNVQDEREVTEEYIWSRIEDSKKKYSVDRSGLILRDLPDALEGKFDLTLGDVRSRMESLWTALRRYLKENGSEHFLDEVTENDTLEAGKFRRATIVDHLTKAVRPVGLKKTIVRQLSENPGYKFSPKNFYDLVIREGEAFEHIHRQTEANKDSKPNSVSDDLPGKESEVKVYKPKKANKVKIKASLVKTSGATCSFCKEEGHYFLFFDKESACYVKNCPKKCDGEIFPKLRKEELTKMESLRSKRKGRSPDKTNAKQAVAEVPSQSTNTGFSTVNDNVFEKIVAAFSAELLKRDRGQGTSGQSLPALQDISSLSL